MNDLYLCHACAGVCNISKANTLNRHSVRFCPLCGAANTLERTRSSFDWHTARCFATLPKHLLQSLSESWGMNAMDEHATWPRFVDYVSARLAQFMADRTARRSGPC